MMSDSQVDNGVDDDKMNESSSCQSAVFKSMTHGSMRFFFLFFFPILWIVFIGLGWTGEDLVETDVNALWTRQRSDYKENLDYAEQYNEGDLGDTTSFAAMAVSRDQGNLFTPSRLEEIRLRMEETENTTVEYGGYVFGWDDICFSNNVGLNTTYKFPCARFSPMDFFKEARWFFQEDDRVTWYKEIARKVVVAPRIPRFGVLYEECTLKRTECKNLYDSRSKANEPLLLFADIGNLEYNDKCKMCIEERVETLMQELLVKMTDMFSLLRDELQNSGHASLAATMETILGKLDFVAANDYYTYKTIRELYAQLGGAVYMESYKEFYTACKTFAGGLESKCGPSEISLEESMRQLRNHADHTFSSISTAGTPLPFWGDDGEGYMLQGNSPVSGSGLNLNGTEFNSTQEYFDELRSTNNTLVDPSSQRWKETVESDPVYRWFIAGETEMAGSCSNGELKGTTGTVYDLLSASLVQDATDPWCTKFNDPFESFENRTQQHFARMWFDLLVDSPAFLNLKQGDSDPYSWTLGQGCGYDLGGQRFSYDPEDDKIAADVMFQEYLMANASGELYYIDEGEFVGPIERTLVMGGLEPKDFSPTNPLTEVSVAQTLYSGLVPEGIVERVKNCNRPGGPIDISVADAEEVLFQFKKKFEDTWTRGWDSESSKDNVLFYGFFDDSGTLGTTGRMLEEITLSNQVLMAISIVIIALFSIIFLFDRDPVESRVVLTLIGVTLVILAFFAALGFGVLVGIKLNINTVWTLPFIMLGLGVDDMYIVMMALKKEHGYTLESFMHAMKEVIIPVTMTSLVNAGMFAIMNLNDIPAVYLTAQVALISVVFLYLTIAFCFPAWCWVDMRRQQAGRCDVLVCKQAKARDEETLKKEHWASFLFQKMYRPFLLGESRCLRLSSHFLVLALAATALAFGIIGLGDRKVGLGLEDFFPAENQASRWATVNSEELASWVIQMQWGKLDYANPDTQLRVIQQYENIINTTYVTELDTKQLWIANFLIWTSRHCTSNFGRDNPEVFECGRDEVFEDGSTCAGVWVENTYGLRDKLFKEDYPDLCLPYEHGICRPTRQMHEEDLADLGLVDSNDGKSWCPVVDNWSNEKFSFCLRRWRELTGGSGSLVLANRTGTPTECSGEYHTDEDVVVPIPISSSPNMYVSGLTSHETTLDMLEETRALCDDDPDIQCWLTGAPYDYWSQYVDIFAAFAELSGSAIGIGFVVAFLFLFLTFIAETHHGVCKVMCSSVFGAFFIAITMVLSLVSVAGLSILVGVNLTGFSNMSIVLSVGFSVEYSVHILQRWLRADPHLTGTARVDHTMSFLMLPTFMSFVSSLIGVACLAFTEFEFNEVFFFRPLLLVVTITYFFGCWVLPVMLCYINFDSLRMGKDSENENAEAGEEQKPDSK